MTTTADSITVDKPIGLLCINDVIDQKLHDEAVAYLESLDRNLFHTITPRSKHRIHIGYGRDEKGEDPIPKELEALAPAMFKSIKSSDTADPELLHLLGVYDEHTHRMTVNVYEPGWSLGDHYCENGLDHFAKEASVRSEIT